MLEINLVPPHLRKKRKARAMSDGTQALPREVLIGLGGGFLLLLLFTHILLQFFITTKFVQHRSFQGEMREMKDQKAHVDSVLKELRAAQAKTRSIEGFKGNAGFSWAKKLNAISDAIPRGTWLKRMTLDGKTLLIQGSAVSKNKTGMTQVHKFTSNLKGSREFSVDFKAIELGLIKTRDVSMTPLADFTITADIKENDTK